jgi:hypothetical protein
MQSKLTKQQGQLAQTLLDRLEKISADSPYAHQASGIRVAIARKISQQGDFKIRLDSEEFNRLLKAGFEILEKAAGEIPEDRNR